MEKIVVVKVGESPEVREVKALDLQMMQEIVGGHIEVLRLTETILLVCNEEGKLRGLPENLALPHDTIVGNVFFCAADGPEMTGLTTAQIASVMFYVGQMSYLAHERREQKRGDEIV